MLLAATAQGLKFHCFGHYWFKASLMATVTTIGLFLLMERLIATTDYVIDETPETIIPEITWKEPPVIDTHKKAIKKIDDPAQPPEIPSQPPTEKLVTALTIPQIEVKTHSGRLQIGFAGGLPVAKLLSAAVYPRGALQRGVEGYVDVRFDVSAIGTTENIHVLRAYPEGVFERAAMAAVKKWRFQPVMENGRGQPFIGMSRRVKFEIQN